MAPRTTSSDSGAGQPPLGLDSTSLLWGVIICARMGVAFAGASLSAYSLVSAAIELTPLLTFCPPVQRPSLDSQPSSHAVLTFLLRQGRLCFGGFLRLASSPFSSRHPPFLLYPLSPRPPGPWLSHLRLQTAIQSVVRLRRLLLVRQLPSRPPASSPRLVHPLVLLLMVSAASSSGVCLRPPPAQYGSCSASVLLTSHSHSEIRIILIPIAPAITVELSSPSTTIVSPTSSHSLSRRSRRPSQSLTAIRHLLPPLSPLLSDT